MTADGARGPIAVIMNAHAGRGDASERAAELRRSFARSPHPVDVTVAHHGDELQRAVAAAVVARAAAVVVAGGDGSVRSAAQHLVEHDIPLGVIPLGTLNHFAKDLGIPLEIEAAVTTVLAGVVRRVDIGEVNGLVFLNNSSVGLWPRILQLRAEHPARGAAKWPIAAAAVLKALARHHTYTVRLLVDGKPLVRRTPLVFVGNNAYHMTGLDPGSRDTLVGGTLALYIVNEVGGLALCRLIWRVIAGHAVASGALDALLATETTITVGHHAMHVAIDGELQELRPPLEYRVRPGALAVLIP